MVGFLEKPIKIESDVLFSVVNCKMRKDASKQRYRGLKIENVELNEGFSVLGSKIRNDVSL